MQIPDITSTSVGDLRPIFEMHAELCKALASEHRLAILYYLKDGEKCVGDVAQELDISVHLVSQHLRILRQRLLVRARKEGQTVYYSITNPKFIQACSLIRQALIEQHSAEGQSLRAAGRIEAMSGGDTVTSEFIG
jgi:ArsR family transcriptional regulator, virulence genes transcriptional regulator